MTALPTTTRGHLTAVRDTEDLTPAGLVPLSRHEWERWIRRIELPTAVRLLALTLSTYANGDGTQVRPGNERLGRVLRCDPRTIRRNRRKLIDLGLLERTAAARRAGLTDVYRLTAPTSITDWPNLLNPDEGEPS